MDIGSLYPNELIMKYIKYFFAAAIFLFSTASIHAQGVEDPTTWSFETQKLSKNEYKLIFHVALKKGWHVFSQNTGDEFLIPPSFLFNKGKYTKKGKVTEEGKLITAKFEGVDNPVNFYEGSAAFIQIVTVNGFQKITGELEYQVCSERMCLPPKKKKFEFNIK